MTRIPINCKTHFSLLKGFCKCKTLAKRCKDYGYKACVIADLESISGAAAFHEQCVANEIKPIIGCDFGSFLLIAKNKKGWFDLIKCVSDKTIENITQIAKNKNLICVTSINANGMKDVFGENLINHDYKKDAVYYVDKEDAVCHRVLLCSGMKTNLPKINKKIRAGEDFENKHFFESDKFYLKKPSDIKMLKKDEKVFKKIDALCEFYEIKESPMLPKFKCPDGFNNEDDYLRQLCRDGWREKLIDSGKVQKQPSEEDAIKIKSRFCCWMSRFLSYRHNRSRSHRA